MGNDELSNEKKYTWSEMIAYLKENTMIKKESDYYGGYDCHVEVKNPETGKWEYVCGEY